MVGADGPAHEFLEQVVFFICYTGRTDTSNSGSTMFANDLFQLGSNGAQSLIPVRFLLHTGRVLK